jgi:tRNA pseudouridine55 synthase
MDGVLVIDKPEDWTSHDVIAKCRNLLKVRKIGHTGTLDPFATGVLTLLVGKATRLAQFLNKDEKEYIAKITFGFETETGDRTGKIKENTLCEEFKLENEKIRETLKTFLGEIEQLPPMFSAKKVKGKKLYELARKNLEIERKAVKVTIFDLELLEIEEESIRLRIVSSSGTYIRTLAEDVGRRLGISAHLSELRRIRSGRFDISRAITLEKLEEIIKQGMLNKVLIPMGEVLEDLPKVILDEANLKRAKNGNSLKIQIQSGLTEGDFVCLLDSQRNLVAIGKILSGNVLPKIVLV